MSDAKSLRVVSVAHTAVQRDAGRLRYLPLAGRMDVHLVVPRSWHQFGREMQACPPGEPGIDVRVEPIWFRSVGPLKWYMHVYPRLPRLMREVKPDVLHLWEEPWSFVSLEATLIKGDAALVLEVDQNILKTLPPPFEWIRRFVLSRTDLILSRHEDADAVVRASGYRGPIARIGYGVNDAVFFPSSEPPRKRKAGEALRIGYVGRIIREKGLDDLLDAMTEAPCTLAAMGEGDHVASLKAKAIGLDLTSRITWTPWKDPAGVGDFMRGLDALVLLTRTTSDVREQFGRVIIEAQACGVPVIGSTCGAIPDVTGPGGWIVPERNPKALAALLRRLADDPDEVRQRGEAGIANVNRRFTNARTAQVLADAWTEAASLAASRRSRSQQKHVGLASGET